MFLSKQFHVSAFVLLPLAFLVQVTFFVVSNGATFDEVRYFIGPGTAYLTTHDFSGYEEHPPLSKLAAALPLAIAGVSNRPLDYLPLARAANVLFGTSLIVVIGLWSRRLWGPAAGTVAMALAAFDPALVSFAGVATSDMPATLFITFSLFLLWRHLESPSLGHLFGFGLVMGAALASKYTALVLPAFLLLTAVLLLARGQYIPLGPNDACVTLTQRLVHTAVSVLVMLLVAFLLVAATYGFGPVSTYIAGVALQMEHSAVGHPSFLLGRFSRHASLAYVPIALFFKTPLSTLVLLLLSPFIFFEDRRRRSDAWFVLVPAAIIVAVVIVGRIGIGIRYVLPAYALLLVFVSQAGTSKRQSFRYVAAILVVLSAFSSLRFLPHSLAYCNVLTGGPAGCGQILSDSNIDWGQDIRAIKTYMDERQLPMIYLAAFSGVQPSAYGIRYQYVPSFYETEKPDELVPTDIPQILAISLTVLQGTYLEHHMQYDWLRQRTPLGMIGYSIYLFDVSDAEAHRHLAHIYRENGMNAHERAELQKAELRPLDMRF